MELGEFLKDRLTNERAAEDWQRLVPELWRATLALPLDAIIPRDQALELLRAHRTEAVAGAWARAMVGLAREARAHVRVVSEPPAALIGDEAVEAFARLAAAPKMVPESWIRHWFAQPAADVLLADVLYRSVRDFSLSVPRLVQSLLPGFLGRFAKMGTGVVGGVAEELESRLEPEVKRYVEKSTRAALDRAAEFSVRQAESPKFVEARANFVRFLAKQPASELVAPLTDEALQALEEGLRSSALHWVRDGALQGILEERLAAAYEANAGRPVGELLDALGLDVDPPFDALASASWPLLRAWMSSEAVQAWLEEIAREYALEGPGPG